MFHYWIVAGVCLFDRVPDWWLVVVFLSEGSLFVHVSSSYKFDSKVISQDLRGFNLVSYNLFHSFQVALEPIHYDGFVSNVEFVGQLLPKWFDSSLHESLFSVDIEHAVVVASVMSDVGSLFGKSFKNLKIFYWNANTTTYCDPR